MQLYPNRCCTGANNYLGASKTRGFVNLFLLYFFFFHFSLLLPTFYLSILSAHVFLYTHINLDPNFEFIYTYIHTYTPIFMCISYGVARVSYLTKIPWKMINFEKPLVFFLLPKKNGHPIVLYSVQPGPARFIFYL